MAGDTEFTITSRIRDALAQLDCSSKDLQVLLQYRSPSREHMPLGHVRLLSSAYKAKLKAAGQPQGPAFLHALTKGSQLWLPGKEPRKQDPAVKARLERLRRLAEDREYELAVKGTSSGPEPIRFVESKKGPRAAARSLRTDLTIGMNMITLMGTGFFVFYYAASGIFPNNKMMHLGSGCVGLFLVMLLETALFVIREQKQEIRQKKFGKKNS